MRPLIISYPRSGYHWLARILREFCDITTIPLKWNHTHLSVGLPRTSMSRVVKAIRLPPDREHRGARTLFLFRHPMDTLYSNWCRQKFGEGTFTGSFGEFVSHPIQGIESYTRVFISWGGWCLSRKPRHKSEFVTYERLHEDPTSELIKAISIVGDGWSPIRDDVRKAANAITFEKMREEEDCGTLDPNLKKVNSLAGKCCRRGSVGECRKREPEEYERGMEYFLREVKGYRAGEIYGSPL